MPENELCERSSAGVVFRQAFPCDYKQTSIEGRIGAENTVRANTLRSIVRGRYCRVQGQDKTKIINFCFLNLKSSKNYLKNYTYAKKWTGFFPARQR